MAKNTGYSSVSKDIQDIANLGLDRDYNVPMAINYVYNPTTDQVDRMVQPGNETPTLGNNPTLVINSADPNNVVFTKTIGATDYQQTIQTSGTTVTITPWSEV